MDTGIGATLRETRNRRKIELSDVEAAIKIRVRYLQAIENEEWDALPGVAYTRGFIRTYAYYLGLDGERLADEYRRGIAPPGERVPKRIEPVPTGARRGGSRRLSGRLLVVAVCLFMVALAVGIGLMGGDGSSPSPSPEAKQVRPAEQRRARDASPPARPGVAMRLAATAEVWVCLLDAAQRPLVDGQILAAGAEAGPFRSDGFALALGNGSVEVFVDDERAEIPPSSSPVGYRIDNGGELIALEEGERPDCE